MIRRWRRSIPVHHITFLIWIGAVLVWAVRCCLVLGLLVAYGAIHHPSVVCERRLSLAQTMTGVPIASEEVEENGSEDDADHGVPNGHASLHWCAVSCIVICVPSSGITYITPPPTLVVTVVGPQKIVIIIIITGIAVGVLSLPQLIHSSRHGHCWCRGVYLESSFLLRPEPMPAGRWMAQSTSPRPSLSAGMSYGADQCRLLHASGAQSPSV